MHFFSAKWYDVGDDHYTPFHIIAISVLENDIKTKISIRFTDLISQICISVYYLTLCKNADVDMMTTLLPLEVMKIVKALWKTLLPHCQ